MRPQAAGEIMERLHQHDLSWQIGLAADLRERSSTDDGGSPVRLQAIAARQYDQDDRHDNDEAVAGRIALPDFTRSSLRSSSRTGLLIRRGETDLLSFAKVERQARKL